MSHSSLGPESNDRGIPPRKIKVLYIDGSIGFGGAPKSLSLLLKGLKNVEPIIMTSTLKDVRKKCFSGYRVYRLGRISNYYRKVRVREWLSANIPAKFLQKMILKSFLLLDFLERWVSMAKIFFLAKFHGVDLIHMNTACFPPEGLYVARLLKIPSISHLRGFFTSKEAVFVNAMRSATLVVAISKAVSKSIDHIKDPENVPIVYDPVDIDLFGSVSGRRPETRRSLGLKETDTAVGIFGRVIPWKGQREFVYACIGAMKKNPDIKAFIVGDPSDSASDYLTEIKKIISESTFEDRFILTGYREDVEELYAAMDIIVHASVTSEPFGMVVPEGMAARRPVIAADAGGPTEIIDSGVDGILVPPGDVGKMSAAILELADDPSKRQRIGENGYRKAKARFTIESMASRIEKLYVDLVQNAHA